MSEMKLCPFCGWEFAEHAWNEFGEEYRVCDQCGASSGTVDSKWDWQSRPIEDELRKRIAELESAQRWIPVSERLPEEDTDGNALMAICRYSGEWVRTAFGAEFADEFVRHYTHWMYAPKPPEVK